jgi:hypothetical protein
MKKIFPIWIFLSILVGLIVISKTYSLVDPDTEFLLFVDIAVILFLVPSCALVYSSVLFILFSTIKSKSIFIIISIILLLLVIIYSFSFFEEVYGIIGLVFFNFEFILLVGLHFYITAFARNLILNKFKPI